MKKSIHFIILFVLSIGIAFAQSTKGDPTVGWKNLLKQMDKDKDGKITHYEFMSIYKKKYRSS